MPIHTNALSEQALRFLSTTSQHAALLLDAGGVIAWVNPAAEELFGASGMVGSHVSRCFLEKDVESGVPRFEIDVADRMGWMEDDRWMRRFDGSRFWAEGVTRALRDEDQALHGFLKLLRNRTTQKMAIETLRNLIAERGDRAQDCETAMFTLAHELRNPLATISACAELLERLPAEDPRLEATRGIMRRSLGFAVRLVDDLVDSTRVSTGRLQLRVERLSVQDLLRSAIATSHERSPNSGHRVELLLPEAGLHLDADPMRMQQVFINLIGNAMRYTPAGGRIWVTAVQLDQSIVFKVEDAGIGIASDVLAHIFDMFTQAQETATRGGLGIGLALVKQIVELHGGSVQAQSDGPGKGAKFIVTVPQRQTGPYAPVVDG